MSALYDPVADLQKYVDGAFVREGIGERFEDDFGFSSEKCPTSPDLFLITELSNQILNLSLDIFFLMPK